LLQEYFTIVNDRSPPVRDPPFPHCRRAADCVARPCSVVRKRRPRQRRGTGEPVAGAAEDPARPRLPLLPQRARVKRRYQVYIVAPLPPGPSPARGEWEKLRQAVDRHLPGRYLGDNPGGQHSAEATPRQPAESAKPPRRRRRGPPDHLRTQGHLHAARPGRGRGGGAASTWAFAATAAARGSGCPISATRTCGKPPRRRRRARRFSSSRGAVVLVIHRLSSRAPRGRALTRRGRVEDSPWRETRRATTAARRCRRAH